MKRKNYIILLLMVTLLACKCKPEDPTPIDPIPPIDTTTIEKENYFYCQIDGKDFKPTNWCASCLNVVYYDYNFTISALNLRTEPASNIYISHTSVNDTGFYQLGLINQGIYYLGFPSHAEFLTNDTIIGFLRITEINAVSRKISGEFEFNTFNADSAKIISITNGIFENIRY